MYKKYYIFLLLIFASPNLLTAQVKMNKTISIIPQPLNITNLEGQFIFDENTVIQVDIANKEQLYIAQTLADFMTKFIAIKVKVMPLGKQKTNVILFKIVKDIDLGIEGYQLNVNAKTIELSAANANGLFYAMETLTQLLPLNTDNEKKEITSVLIKDAPKYPYRAMLLDVGRTFYPVEFVKKFIDFLAFHKMNTFHWHLTEDQGWRIEIKKYPELTNIGAWRNGSLIGMYDNLPHLYDNKRTGGFYTQDQIKEVVAYAKQKYIEVIPEIEMPGHAQAALAAYPNLSCSGGPFEVSQLWGVRNDIFCAGNEQTFTFLENVLSEVSDLFPSPYIHIGGDESPKIRWHNCVKCQTRIKNEKLKDEHDLQNYFVNRIAKYLQTKGKKIIGWDDILTDGVTKDAVIMSWRGIMGGISGAKAKHNVIMAPESIVYLDYYQGEPSLEPQAIGGFTTLKKVYDFNPIPKELNTEESKYIMGVEGTLWTEYITTPEYAEYMLMPRMSALAETMWSTSTNKDWESFKYRMETQYDRYDNLQINYAKSAYNVQHSVDSTSNNILISLFTHSFNPDIRYTINGDNPTLSSDKYNEPIKVSIPYTIKAINVKNGQVISKISTFKVDQ